MQSGPDYWLRRDFQNKKKKNKSYSLRAYSQHLGVSASRLSQIFNGKRTISHKMALKIFDKLNLDSASEKQFLTSLNHLGRSAKIEINTEHEQYLVSQKSFDLIADPIHFAILSLIECDDFISQSSWIAERLSSDVMTINSALKNLKDLDFISYDGNEIRLTHRSGVKTSDHQINRALRKSHKAQLEKAIDCLETVPLELRDFTSEFMAIDLDLLPEAKQLIRDFRKKLSKLMESKRKTQVYQLSVQLIPLTELTKESGN